MDGDDKRRELGIPRTVDVAYTRCNEPVEEGECSKFSKGQAGPSCEREHR